MYNYVNISRHIKNCLLTCMSQKNIWEHKSAAQQVFFYHIYSIISKNLVTIIITAIWLATILAIYLFDRQCLWDGNK